MPRRAEAENVIRFTKTAVAALTLRNGQSERTAWDLEVPGFGIRIRASGNRSWVIRAPRSGGDSRLHTIGSANSIDLASARRTAREKLAETALGGDPTKARREARAQAAVTFGSLIDRYVAHKEAQGRRGATIYGIKNHLNNHWQPLHDRPLSAITKAEIAIRHREIAADSPHAADRALSILSTFFGWAMRDGLVDANPAANANKATVPTKRERVLTNAELVAVWRECRDDDYGRIVRLLILTGLRLREVAGMRWSEINRATGHWDIPAARMKNRRPHDVPLPAAALAILAEVPEQAGRDFVFGSGEGAFSGFSKAKKAMDKRLGSSVGKWTQHDLRRTTDTGMNSIGILPHIVEAVLSHVSGHRAGVAGIYNRAKYLPERRDALERWEKFVFALL
ncbi:site-specific integrase [Methylobacterium sp. WL64]|uniref:tyrosine-type recombinase/integrase n=1 Tax=Methylobacterium sp. WL64 TaxID=2603894 RepID=UPI001650699E|nr:site-specific integrase [Methylobacterium sp. WL64]